jgi:hypothetical protein
MREPLLEWDPRQGLDGGHFRHVAPDGERPGSRLEPGRKESSHKRATGPRYHRALPPSPNESGTPRGTA